MPIINVDGCQIHVEVQGDEGAPVLMLSNSLGTTTACGTTKCTPLPRHSAWYDTTGADMAGRAVPEMRTRWSGLAVLDALGIDRINWCGLSMGGMVGMWLGTMAPEQINKLILSNTAAYFDKAFWDDRIKTVRESGLAPIATANMERWLTRDFRERSPQAVERIRDMFLSTLPEGYVDCCEAIRDMDHREIIRKIAAPTLVIAGRHDPATTVEAAGFIRIPARCSPCSDAAHLSNVEQPRVYADTVLGFLLQK